MSGVSLAQGERSLARIVQAVRYLLQGRDNACGTVTLTANASSTVVSAPNCAATSEVFLEAKTADAAAERASGNLYISAIANGSFTVAHTDNAVTDRTFGWMARG